MFPTSFFTCRFDFQSSNRFDSKIPVLSRIKFDNCIDFDRDTLFGTKFPFALTINFDSRFDYTLGHFSSNFLLAVFVAESHLDPEFFQI